MNEFSSQQVHLIPVSDRKAKLVSEVDVIWYAESTY